MSSQEQPPESQELLELVAKYEGVGRRYYDNAIRFVKEKEYSKAGENLWGVVIQYLKITALLLHPHRPLPTGHKEIKKFVTELSNSLRDQDLSKLYKKAEKLHANFYENFLDEEEFGERFNETETLLKKLFELSRGSERTRNR